MLWVLFLGGHHHLVLIAAWGMGGAVRESRSALKCARASGPVHGPAECDWSVQRCKRSEAKLKVIVGAAASIPFFHFGWINTHGTRMLSIFLQTFCRDYWGIHQHVQLLSESFIIYFTSVSPNTYPCFSTWQQFVDVTQLEVSEFHLATQKQYFSCLLVYLTRL